MSREALAKVIQRSISDGAFRRQLATDPTGALRGYDLSADEFSAVKSGDPTRLTALGVEQRMSKAFTLGGDAAGGSGAVSYSVTSDLGAGGSGALTAGDGASGSAVLTSGGGAIGSAMHTSGGGAMGSGALTSGGGAAGSGALTGGAGAGGSAALTSGDGNDADPIIASGNEVGRDAAVIPGNADHALGDDTDPDGPQWFHTLTPADPVDAHGIVVDDDAGRWPGETGQHFADDAGGGAATPGEAPDGPEIQQ